MDPGFSPGMRRVICVPAKPALDSFTSSQLKGTSIQPIRTLAQPAVLTVFPGNHQRATPRSVELYYAGASFTGVRRAGKAGDTAGSNRGGARPDGQSAALIRLCQSGGVARLMRNRCGCARILYCVQNTLQIGKPERFFQQRQWESRVTLIGAILASGQCDRADT